MEKKTNYSIQTLLESRSFLYVLLLIVTICFVSTYTKIYDVKLDMNGDNIHYYALGKALAEGKGFTNTISFSETPHTHFPPGYPVFVAGVMKFFPDNINAVKIANGILLYAAILLLFFLLKKISGSIIVAFLTCVFCSIHAEILRYATIMMSEMLFLFCSRNNFLPKKGYGIRSYSFFFCSWSTISILSGLWALRSFWQLSFIAVYSFSNRVMPCTKIEKPWKNPRPGKLLSNSY